MDSAVSSRPIHSDARISVLKVSPLSKELLPGGAGRRDFFWSYHVGKQGGFFTWGKKKAKGDFCNDTEEQTSARLNVFGKMVGFEDCWSLAVRTWTYDSVAQYWDSPVVGRGARGEGAGGLARFPLLGVRGVAAASRVLPPRKTLRSQELRSGQKGDSQGPTWCFADGQYFRGEVL